MFRSKTVFVVGAGASKEAGLPIGRELKPKIARCTGIWFGHDFELERGDHKIVEALRLHASSRSQIEGRKVSINDYLPAGRRISSAMPQASSIDAFIDSHDGNEAIEICGKLAIAKTILDAERSSTMYFDQRRGEIQPAFEQLEDTWFARLLQALTTNCRKSHIEGIFDQIAVITFNYDRCIEHFLYCSLQNFYGITPKEAASLLKSLRIFHPYGKVGHLPWQNAGSNTLFGATAKESDLLLIAKQIRTFTEQIDDEQSLSEMRTIIATAHQIVFLGFAFHEQNMEILRPGNEAGISRVLATGKGLSDSDCNIVRAQIEWSYRRANGQAPSTNLRNDLTCSGLFDEFWRTLTS